MHNICEQLIHYRVQFVEALFFVWHIISRAKVWVVCMCVCSGSVRREANVNHSFPFWYFMLRIVAQMFVFVVVCLYVSAFECA